MADMAERWRREAQAIVKAARLDCLNRQAVHRRLAEAFPGTELDYAAHAEMRAYGLQLYDAAEEEKGDMKLAKLAKAPPPVERIKAEPLKPRPRKKLIEEPVGKAAPVENPCLEHLQPGMELLFMEKSGRRRTWVGTINNVCGWITAVVIRPNGRTHIILTGDCEKPLSSFEDLSEIPELGWMNGDCDADDR